MYHTSTYWPITQYDITVSLVKINGWVFEWGRRFLFVATSFIEQVPFNMGVQIIMRKEASKVVTESILWHR